MVTQVSEPSVRFVLYVLFHSLSAGRVGIAFSTDPPTKGTNIVTMMYISAPIAVVARICIGVEPIACFAITVNHAPTGFEGGIEYKKLTREVTTTN